MLVGADLDAVDEFVEELLGDASGPAVDRLSRLPNEGRQPLGGGQAHLVMLGLAGEFGAADGELVAALRKFIDAWCAEQVGHGAGLERAQVAVDRGGCLLQLGIDARDLSLDVWPLVGDGVECLLRGSQQEVGVGVSGDQLFEDRGLQQVGDDPRPSAAVGAFGLAVAADVVAVIAVASVGAGADVGAAAGGAAQLPGQQVFRVGRRDRPGHGAAFAEQRLRPGVDVGVDDRFVLAS